MFSKKLIPFSTVKNGNELPLSIRHQWVEHYGLELHRLVWQT